MKWEIEISAPFGGLAPAFWETTYPSYGNKNQAGKLKNVDLTNPSFITQGRGLANLTNGTQEGVVDTLMRGILDMAVKDDETYAIGKDKLYKLSSTEVIDETGVFPHTIEGEMWDETDLCSPTANKAVDGENPWTNPTNAYTSNNAYATATTTEKHIWYTFKKNATALIDLIPVGATIRGIEVKVEAKCSEAGKQILVALTKNANDTAGSAKVTPALTTGDVIYTLGDSDGSAVLALWNTTWTRDDFGVNFGVRVTPSYPEFTYSIDHIQVIVYYSTPTTNEMGEDVAYYQSKIYYSYNTDEKGEIGQLTLPSTFDDNWSYSVPIGATVLQKGVPHPLSAAGNDILYIGNKNYVSSYRGDDDIFTEKDLDLPPDCIVQDLDWASNVLWVATNRPNISGSNKNIASIYVWDGNSPSWENEIVIMGRIGALIVKNGIVFVFYEDITSTGGYKLGYVSGNRIEDAANFTGSLPSYYQVTEYKNFIIWVSAGEIWAWGSVEKNIPAILFQLADGGYSTVGGLACPFGTPMVASYESTTYKLAKFSGYTKDCSWYSLLFDITANARKSMIDKVKFNFEKLADPSRCDYILKDNKGVSLKTGTISFALDGAATTKDFYPKCLAENFRVELEWLNGSTANPVSFRNIRIFGHTIS